MFPPPRLPLCGLRIWQIPRSRFRQWGWLRSKLPLVVGSLLAPSLKVGQGSLAGLGGSDCGRAGGKSSGKAFGSDVRVWCGGLGLPREAIMVNLVQIVRDHWVHILVPMGFVLGWYMDRRNDEKLTAFRNKSMLFKRELRPNEEVTWK